MFAALLCAGCPLHLARADCEPGCEYCITLKQTASVHSMTWNDNVLILSELEDGQTLYKPHLESIPQCGDELSVTGALVLPCGASWPASNVNVPQPQYSLGVASDIRQIVCHQGLIARTVELSAPRPADEWTLTDITSSWCLDTPMCLRIEVGHGTYGYEIGWALSDSQNFTARRPAARGARWRRSGEKGCSGQMHLYAALLTSTPNVVPAPHSAPRRCRR